MILLLLLVLFGCLGSSEPELVQRDFGRCDSMDVVAELAGKDFEVYACENGDLVLTPVHKPLQPAAPEDSKPEIDI